jgi:hypothetical protein
MEPFIPTAPCGSERLTAMRDSGRCRGRCSATSGSMPCYASSILQILFDHLLVFGYVTTARLFAAPSTFQVVGGIHDFTSWANVVFPDFLEPLSIANRLDSFKIDP